MPTSKLPVELAAIPKAVFELSWREPRVICNSQMVNAPRPLKNWNTCGDSEFMNPCVTEFLSGLKLPATVALCFQGYGKRNIGTAVIRLESIYWTDEGRPGYPRLDFAHPKAMSQVNGCPNFWGAFILALFKLDDSTEVFAVKGYKKFLQLAAGTFGDISTKSSVFQPKEDLSLVAFSACSQVCQNIQVDGFPRGCLRNCPGKFQQFACLYRFNGDCPNCRSKNWADVDGGKHGSWLTVCEDCGSLTIWCREENVVPECKLKIGDGIHLQVCPKFSTHPATTEKQDGE
ncbi:MAG: hypothetical protein NTW11_01815 [Candidatus Staskawiczbacteria bacterium]|nr:hypothetical protein [Candidatus Staskawiczbacteria bacterium]